MFQKMTFLQALQKNQKVINSCITVEQAVNSRLYTKLINGRWYDMDAKDKGVYGSMVSKHHVQELASFTKFMREEKIKTLTEAQEVDILHIPV